MFVCWDRASNSHYVYFSQVKHLVKFSDPYESFNVWLNFNFSEIQLNEKNQEKIVSQNFTVQPAS